jgi:hypothetical protein
LQNDKNVNNGAGFCMDNRPVANSNASEASNRGGKKISQPKTNHESVFGIIKSVLGFTSFHLRGLEGAKKEWNLMVLAHNCKRLSKLMA